MAKTKLRWQCPACTSFSVNVVEAPKAFQPVRVGATCDTCDSRSVLVIKKVNGSDPVMLSYEIADIQINEEGRRRILALKNPSITAE